MPPDAAGHFATRPRPERTTLHYVAAILEDQILAEAEECLAARGAEVSSIHLNGLLARHVGPGALGDLVSRLNAHLAGALGRKVEFAAKKWAGGFFELHYVAARGDAGRAVPLDSANAMATTFPAVPTFVAPRFGFRVSPLLAAEAPEQLLARWGPSYTRAATTWGCGPRQWLAFLTYSIPLKRKWALLSSRRHRAP